MKLRTSFFNPTAFRKNLTRFAPAWGLYTLCLLLGLMIMMDTDLDYWQVRNMAECIQVMPVVNLGYALLCAMLLFGDLYNSRMCNALHALPLRREGWFLTNIASGLFFSLVPSLVMTVLAIPLCAASKVTDDWQVPLYWLLGNNLQFIAFFGIAAFSALCVGSRFAMAVVYGILNFGSLLAYWMVETLYTPLLYGVRTNELPFLHLSPVVHMVETNYIDTEVYRAEDAVTTYVSGGTFTLTEGWGLLWIWAAVGAALMVAALLLYRRRNLECAGDFLSVKAMEPVFLGIYTLAMGVAFQFFQTIFIGGSGEIWMFIGLPVGYFTGLMLLRRTPRVFRKKTFAVCGGILLAVALSLLIPAFDLLGIESWIPEKDEVKSVGLSSGHVYSTYGDVEEVLLEDEDDIETALQLHELALEDRKYFDGWHVGAGYAGYYDADIMYREERCAVSFTLIYELENGRTVYRYYNAFVDSESGEILRPWFSDIQAVLGITEEEIPEFAASINEFYLDGEPVADYLTEAQCRELLEAIAADCREGTMAQRWAFHEADYGDDVTYSLEFESSGEHIGQYYWHTVQIYGDSRHTRQWLEDNLLDKVTFYDSKY